MALGYIALHAITFRQDCKAPRLKRFGRPQLCLCWYSGDWRAGGVFKMVSATTGSHLSHGEMANPYVGRCWDVTIICSLADSYVSGAAPALLRLV